MRKNILVVGDRVVSEEVERCVMARAPATLLHARTPQEALNLHQRGPAHLILLCTPSAPLRAVEFCRALRTDPSLRRTSVLLVTDGSASEEVDEALQGGANGVVHRPLTVMVLLKVLSRFLDVAPRRDVQLTTELHSFQRLESAVTVNISCSGLLVDVQEPLLLGTPVVCHVSLPSGPGVQLAGQVVRKADGGPAGRRRYGIRFTRPTRDEERRINAVVYSDEVRVG